MSKPGTSMKRFLVMVVAVGGLPAVAGPAWASPTTIVIGCPPGAPGGVQALCDGRAVEVRCTTGRDGSRQACRVDVDRRFTLQGDFYAPNVDFQELNRTVIRGGLQTEGFAMDMTVQVRRGVPSLGGSTSAGPVHVAAHVDPDRTSFSTDPDRKPPTPPR